MTMILNSAHLHALMESVRLEDERLQVIAHDLELSLPVDKQGYTGRHTAFTIIAALQAKLEALLASDAIDFIYGNEKCELCGLHHWPGLYSGPNLRGWAECYYYQRVKDLEAELVHLKRESD